MIIMVKVATTVTIIIITEDINNFLENLIKILIKALKGNNMLREVINNLIKIINR